MTSQEDASIQHVVVDSSGGAAPAAAHSSQSSTHSSILLNPDSPSSSERGDYAVMRDQDHNGRKVWPEPAICRSCPCDVFPLVMLFFICFLTFGSYWVYDTPGAIQTQLTTWFGHNYTKSKNLNLYSIYSWPNVILPFFSGFIIDKVTGVRWGSMLFVFLIAAGQAIFCVGVSYRAYYIAFAGRFVFGLGGESLTVAQNSYTLRWFDGKNLALAFGLVVSFARVGSSVNFALTPTLAHSGVPFAVWFGFGMTMLSFLMGVCCFVADWYGEPRVEALAQAKREKAEAEGKVIVEEEVKLSHITQFPLSAWLLYLICLFFYVGVLAFYEVASDIMQHTGGHFSKDAATLMVSIPNFVSIAASPLFGAVVDKRGGALSLIAVASVMMVLVHIGFLASAYEWVNIHPTILMTFLGLAYSLGAACMWPILSLVVEERLVSTGYGVMTAVQNLGLAVFPMLIGKLQDAAGPHSKLKYTLPILIFIGCEGVSLLLTLTLIGVDKVKHGGLMNMSSVKRVELEKKSDGGSRAISAGNSKRSSLDDGRRSRGNSNADQLTQAAAANADGGAASDAAYATLYDDAQQ